MRFQVLGPVAAYGERGPVALGPSRQRTVLAALVVEPGTAVSFDQLIDRVWGGRPPRRARETMHSYLSRVRTVLGDVGGPTIVRHSHGYVLEVAPEAVDLYRFRALVQEARRTADDGSAAARWDDALALWQGPPLADLDSDWARAVATGLETERLAATLDRNDVLLRRDDHAGLLPALTADAAAYPLDERLAGQLMLGLYRAGRQADALAHYRSLMQRLADELGSDPGPALQRLHQQVLRQDPRLAATTVATSQRTATPVATDGPGAARPAQLPADIAGFTGRSAPLRQLDALLGAPDEPPATVVITAIGGTAGVGKTALAVHWAHQVRDRFPDGQLYLNLRGFTPGGQVMSAAEALRNLLELLDVPLAQIPTSVEAQAGLYRTRLAGTRTLVVLDNARDTEQVRPLIPGSPGSMVLVTSRNQLAGLAAAEGARLVRLDVLGDEEARQLLIHRLGAQRVTGEPDAVAKIVTASAGLPLALAIVAARAAARPAFPLSAFSDELADARDRLEALADPDVATDVRAVFSWSYDALHSPAARMFRLLGLHPGPDVSLPAAASLAGVSAPDARRLLAELANAHLITEHVPGRYLFHDLLRAYAAERASTIDAEDDRRAARHRMLDHYLHSTAAADQWLPRSAEKVTPTPLRSGVIPATFTSNATAVTWLTTEHHVLLAILERGTADSDGDGSGFDAHIQQLALAINSFLMWSGRWPDKVTAQVAGLQAAYRRADLPAQAVIHRGLAHAYAQLERYEEAHSHIREARRRYEEIGDHTGQARTWLVLAWVCEREGRYADGLRYAHQCLDTARTAGNRTVQALARNAIGWCHTLLGEHEEAITHCEQALAELREVSEGVSLSDVLNSLGRAHRHLGQFPQAIDYYQQAVDWSHHHNSRWNEAENLVLLGEVHQAAGRHDATREVWRRALDIFDEVGHPDADELRTRIAGLA